MDHGHHISLKNGYLPYKYLCQLGELREHFPSVEIQGERAFPFQLVREENMGANRGFIFALLGFLIFHGWSLYSAQAAVHNYTFIVSVS